MANKFVANHHKSTSKLKVVTIISRMNVGGPAVLISELDKYLDSHFEHVLVTGYCEGDEVDFLDLHGIQSKVIYLKSLGRSVSLVGDALALLRIIRVLIRERPDVVHTHTFKAGMLGRLAAKTFLPRAKLVHTYHGHLLYGYFGARGTKVVIILERVLAKLSDVLIAVSAQVQNDMVKMHIGSIKKWRIIRPAISDVNTLELQSLKSNFYGDTPTIAWVGRFAVIKDPLAMIKIVKECVEKLGSVFNVIMVGDGNLHELCKSKAVLDNLPIEFTGWLEDVTPVFARTNLLVMTSKNEGMPVVILEAARFGIPTLALNVGGINEFIQNSVTGFLEDTPESLEIELQRLIKNPQIVLRVGATAKLYAEREFNINNYIKKHVEIYLSK
jgi:glycosyltransferase involved in cell wall biosynthesis